VFDYSNACAACAPECYRGRAGGLFWFSRQFAFSWRKAFEFSLLPGP